MFENVTYTLVQQLEQRRGDSVVVASVNDLDGENVESPDELPSLRQVGHARLQQDQHDHVHQVVQDLQGIEVVQQHSLPIAVSVTCMVACLTRSLWLYMDMSTMVRYWSSRITSLPFALSIFILVCRTYRYCA